MTRDEIVQIAWDCGILMRSHKHQDDPTKLERFAERIAAREREACAKVAESYEPRCEVCPSGVSNAIRARGEV